ncbi:MAG: chorismate-binding protein [Cryobacterium sp.]|nr:chorismate-binding protein [Cryobacterium sp.]MBX3090548.1 chorismate-binding protein [Cryobacterium sp.]MBX3115834.1 chorismate-binding protein [Cryobacterium sp.]MCO5293939.1 chorismate-binding protein [Homoserinimonas sp.]
MRTTERTQFNELASIHKVVPVVRTLFADGETPIGVYRKLGANSMGSFLLESAEQGGIWSRYSFIGASSYGILSEDCGRASWIEGDAPYGLSETRAFGGRLDASPLEAVSYLHERWSSGRIPDLPPLTGGLVGFIGWDAIREIENLGDGPSKETAVPIQALSFVRELVIIDHSTGEVSLLFNALIEASSELDEIWIAAQLRLDELQSRLAAPSEAWLASIDRENALPARNRVSAEEFKDAVTTAKHRIGVGDIFQVVLSQRFDLEIGSDPLDIYRILRTLNPSPYMYFLAFATTEGEPYWVVGSSPEALVKASNGRVFTHPIAGSRHRGATPELDSQLARELEEDQKERAEHLMLVDLARNDLLKICVPGTVEVTEFMQVERFSHIMHLVSSVEGELQPTASPIDVFKATFPAGTLSGAPKPKALEVIDELEPAGRGIYGGVVGYFALSGDLDLAIAIRTAVISGGLATVQAGAGIVADSNPDSEFTETVNKAAAPLRAIGIAESLKRTN